ncbi:hypothetical protein CHUAL_009141 [Chamberlinius hualienensis]
MANGLPRMLVIIVSLAMMSKSTESFFFKWYQSAKDSPTTTTVTTTTAADTTTTTAKKYQQWDIDLEPTRCPPYQSYDQIRRICVAVTAEPITQATSTVFHMICEVGYMYDTDRGRCVKIRTYVPNIPNGSYDDYELWTTSTTTPTPKKNPTQFTYRKSSFCQKGEVFDVMRQRCVKVRRHLFW